MQQCISPVDGSIYIERPHATDAETAAALERAHDATSAWKETPIPERAAFCAAMVDAFVADAEVHAEELAWQMGRPIRYGKGEVSGLRNVPGA